MSDYSAGSAIFMSIIVGLILSIFFDSIFAIMVAGFMATYITRPEERHTIIGIITSLIVGVFIFLYGMINGPEMPYRISSLVEVDPGSFIIGFTLICLFSVALGALSGYIASKTAKNKDF
ncbi:MAG: hypothetical protein U1C19_02600 [Methanobacteriaceae archaeon]|jgi:hypothetical protein|nr:hypothetical protein [Methanobacteriaceae archaeon]